MSTPAEGMVLILLLLGTKATDDAAVAASKRARTWALRHRWDDCVDFDEVIVLLLPVFSVVLLVEEVYRNRLSYSDKVSQCSGVFDT